MKNKILSICLCLLTSYSFAKVIHLGKHDSFLEQFEFQNGIIAIRNNNGSIHFFNKDGQYLKKHRIFPYELLGSNKFFNNNAVQTSNGNIFIATVTGHIHLFDARANFIKKILVEGYHPHLQSVFDGHTVIVTNTLGVHYFDQDGKKVGELSRERGFLSEKPTFQVGENHILYREEGTNGGFIITDSRGMEISTGKLDGNSHNVGSIKLPNNRYALLSADTTITLFENGRIVNSNKICTLDECNTAYFRYLPGGNSNPLIFADEHTAVLPLWRFTGLHFVSFIDSTIVPHKIYNDKSFGVQLLKLDDGTIVINVSKRTVVNQSVEYQNYIQFFDQKGNFLRKSDVFATSIYATVSGLVQIGDKIVVSAKDDGAKVHILGIDGKLLQTHHLEVISAFESADILRPIALSNNRALITTSNYGSGEWNVHILDI